MEDARYQAIEHNVRSVAMPKLACMEAMRDEKLSVYEAAEGERGASGRRCRWVSADAAVQVTADEVGQYCESPTT